MSRPIFEDMFVRKKKNASGSISVQIVEKQSGTYHLLKTVGCGHSETEVEKLVIRARQEITNFTHQLSFLISEKDTLVEHAFSSLSNSNVRTIGPEIIFGRIYDSIGFNVIEKDLFRHLVISRLSFPLSKLKTVEYLYRYQGISVNINTVYRFLDELNDQLKSQIEQIAYTHTLKVLKGNLSVVFYDMTTLYFEASDEDDLRKTGFSKDGKHKNPQIFLGLLVGLGGYAIGYDIFEGNIYEGHTLIPFIENMSRKFNLGKPVIIADSGLLSKSNIEALKEREYEFIIGARLKNESELVKKKVIEHHYEDGECICIEKENGDRLIVSYSQSRAKKDEHNRTRGINRLEKQIQSGKLTKANINNRGYNRYLKLEGKVTIEIDYDKFTQDKLWDGLKGYVTNTKLTPAQTIENYNNLWHIEKAFRMSKTDLRIRPIYHRIKGRIEAHICIAFTAYCIYKELERILCKEKSTLSVKRAAEFTHNMYEITYSLPDSLQTKSQLLKMDEGQSELFRIINKNF